MFRLSLYLSSPDPPGDQGLWSRTETLALDVIRLLRGEELLFGQNVNCHWFYWRREMDHMR